MLLFLISGIGTCPLKSSIQMLRFHCWWRSEHVDSKLKLCLLRNKSQIQCLSLTDEAPAEWQLFQKVLKDHPLIQDTLFFFISLIYIF